MSATDTDEVTTTHQAKEFLKNLGKRSQCFLQLTQTTDPNNPAYSHVQVVDDVGAPVANVRSYRIEYKQNEGAILHLEIMNISVQVTTQVTTR